MGRAFIIPLHIYTLSPAVFGSKDSGCDSGNPDQEKSEKLVVSFEKNTSMM
jgi:hypothetical protein